MSVTPTKSRKRTAGLVAASTLVGLVVVPSTANAAGSNIKFSAAEMLASAGSNLKVINGAITSASVVQTTAAQNTNVDINVAWVVPDGTKAGDTFTLTLQPAAFWDSIVSSAFDLKDASGNVVAKATISGKVVTFTMTAYAENHINVKGTAKFQAKIAKDATLGNNTVTLSTPGKDFSDTINVTKGIVLGDNTKQIGIEPDGNGDGKPDGGAWRIHTGAAAKAGTVTITDTPTPGLTLDCSTIKVRISNVLQPASAVKNCSTTTLTVVVTVKAGDVVDVFGLSPFPANAQAGQQFTNTGTISIDGKNIPVTASLKYPSSGGEGSGDQFVTGGDRVWFDEDHNGIQDPGESGIEGVTLTLSRTDGGTITDYQGNPYDTTVVTDADGMYQFTNLPIEGADWKYKVCVSTNTVPDGYLPTLTGKGTTATDSSTGCELLTGLTTLGAQDMKADFGFWLPVPQVSIVKGDTKGNAADTADDAVDLGTGLSGSASIVYTITNEGNEPLKNVDVKDVVVSNGDVKNLKCVFPDGSTGTVYAGNLAVGVSFDCTADLTNVIPGELHQDTGSVTGVGTVSGTTVNDENDYFASIAAPGSVTIGDTFQVDENRNGVQDAGDTPLAGIKFTVRRDDGQPALNADGSTPTAQVTNAQGKYFFRGLAILPPGVRYQAVLDVSTVPAGFVPAKAGQGTRATDYEYGVSTSTDLTTDGAEDLTLDQGVQRAYAPAISITKGDDKGNAADTAADAVALGVAPAAANLVYVIRNTGDEDLTEVRVTDKVISNGTVSGLECTFPDGTKGVLYGGVFKVGDSFTCTGRLTGVSTEGLHQDTGSVVATGVNTGTRVDDDNDYWASAVGSVSIGNFVARDKGTIGVQDPADIGIQGVRVIVSRTDNQPVVNADGSTPAVQVTDAKGFYRYDGLAVLPAGVRYLTTVDQTTVPAGLVPTKTGMGTRETDYSAGSAEALELRAGEEDMSLDYAFVPAPPQTKVLVFQFDTYSWGAPAKKKPSLTYGKKIAALDDDGKLPRGEDFFVGLGAAKPYTSKRVGFVTVSVPTNATNAQIMAALNTAAKAQKWPALTTTSKLGAVTANGTVTDAWLLGKGATTANPWGPKRDVPQIYFARSGK